MSTPLWLTNPEVLHFLTFVVDRLDQADAQGKPLARSLKLDARSFPAVYRSELEATKEQAWVYLEQMAAWGWIRIKLDRAHPGIAPYELNPRVTVLDPTALRKAVGRLERVRPYAEHWREAVDATLRATPEVKEAVARYRIEIPGRSAAEIVAQLNHLPAMSPNLLLREVSSLLFWAQSKILDGKQALVAAVLGIEECPFSEMPIQLQVFLPSAGFDEVLFIENQATFELATRDNSGVFNRLALIYAAGFKGSAQRLRSATGSSLYFAHHGTLAAADTEKLRAWLREDILLPSWFWGDLDNSGMQILASLRKTIKELGAWQPGYQPMRAILELGGGHAPDAAGKSLQRPVAHTGCAYADTELLPVLARTGRFVDQEVVGDCSWIDALANGVVPQIGGGS